MSTIKTVNLIVQERDAFAAAYQAMHQLIMVRGLQVVAADEETQAYRDDAVKAEKNADDTYELIDEIAKEFTGQHSMNALKSLSSIRNRMHGMVHECERLRGNAQRYEKLIHLCMTGARGNGYPEDETACYTHEAEKAIVEEVNRLKAEEIPF